MVNLTSSGVFCCIVHQMVLGLVDQSIDSLTSLLRGRLVKCFYDFITKYTYIFCLKKRKAFVDNCWHFNIYEQEKFHAQLS